MFDFRDTELARQVASACRGLLGDDGIAQGAAAAYRALDDAGMFDIAFDGEQIEAAAMAARVVGETVAAVSVADEVAKRVLVPAAEAPGGDWARIGVGRLVTGTTAVVRMPPEPPRLYLLSAPDCWRSVSAAEVDLDGSGAFDPTAELGRLRLRDALAGQAVTGPHAETATTAHQVLTAAELMGCAATMFDRTLDYLKTRRQFDRSIGAFQALQHRMADTYVDLQAAELATQYARHLLTDGPVSATAAAWVAAASAYAAEAALRLSKTCFQLHGGIAFTTEFWVHRYLRRVHRLSLQGGDPGRHYHRAFDLLPDRTELERFIVLQQSVAGAGPRERRHAHV